MERTEKGDILDVWQRETDLADADIYKKYLLDGDPRGWFRSSTSKARLKR